MNKVIFELKDGTKKEFDGEKFTDEQVAVFNTGACSPIPCEECQFNSDDCEAKWFLIKNVVKCYRVTEEPKPIQILKRLIEGGSVWVYGDERNISDLSIGDNTSWYSLKHEHITLEKPKKKIKVEQWINVYPDGCIVPYNSKESADCGAGRDRIACDHFVKEYEV